MPTAWRRWSRSRRNTLNIWNSRTASSAGEFTSDSMWGMASERETYKWLSPLPKEAKIKLGTAELIMSHAKIDRQGKVHRYVPKLKAAVLTENAIAVMPDGKKARYDSQKAKCQKVVPLSRALEILNTLLQQTVQSNSLQDNAEDDTTMQSIDMSSALEDEETISPNIQISLGLEDLLRLYCIGFFIIVVSVTVSSVSVMRLKPRDILNRMS